DEPSTGRRPWDIDQEMAAAALGVRTYILRADDIAQTVDRAADKALRRRMPVVISIPYDFANTSIGKRDVAEAEINLEDPATVASLLAATLAKPEPTIAPAPAIHRRRVSEARIDEAVRLLSTAERPLVLAGRGAHLAGAGPQLARIA